MYAYLVVACTSSNIVIFLSGHHIASMNEIDAYSCCITKVVPKLSNNHQSGTKTLKQNRFADLFQIRYSTAFLSVSTSSSVHAPGTWGKTSFDIPFGRNCFFMATLMTHYLLLVAIFQ